MDRNNALRRKLASRRGASITFALLLFLVCTIVGVIVIVAASAASGRVSGMPLSDTRNYAVNSAIDILRDQIGGSSVTVTWQGEAKMTVTTTEYVYSTQVGNEKQYARSQGVTVTPVSGYTPDKYNYNDAAAVTVTTEPAQLLPFLQEAARAYVLGFRSSISDKAEKFDALYSFKFDSSNPAPNLTSCTLNLEHEVNGEWVKVANTLPVKIEAELDTRPDTQGWLIVTLSCTTAETVAGTGNTSYTYTVRLFFKPQVQVRSENVLPWPTGTEAAVAGDKLEGTQQLSADELTLSACREATVSWIYSRMERG